jgi:OOP family OmpA-OmpF porin
MLLLKLRGSMLAAVLLWFATDALLVANTWAQASPDQYVAPLQAELNAAQAERLELLAPRGYARVNDLLKNLQAEVKAGKKPERLQQSLADAQKALALARQTAMSSNSTLDTVIKAHDDALTANASQLAGASWIKADERFKEAIERVESNNVEAARRKGAEAEVLLRDAELIAIKSATLGEVRDAIAKAQQAKVPDFAPRSFATAQQLLSEAEKRITSSRYELAEPKRLVVQAAYEIRHAGYLAGQIERARSKDGMKQQAAEAQWLALEEAVRNVANELEVEAHFDDGYASTLQQLRDKAQRQQQELIALRRTVGDRDEQLTELNAEINKLEAQLGGASEDRMALQKRLSTQDRLRDNISKVESSFTADEGRVYRESNNLVMSLNAISFRSGKSTIEPASFPVLAKVGEALKLFPAATLTVEGHTDNQGSDSSNLLLSQDRADAVRQYLISNLSIDAEKITSIGYGKARPVANNDTDSGRARNRRIDIVMKIEGN